MSTSQTWDIGYALCGGGGQFDCGRLADFTPEEQMEAIQNWNIGSYKIDYCLSSQRSTENLCSVEYSFSIMLSISNSYPTNTLRLLTLGFSRLHIQPLQMHAHMLHCIVSFKPRGSSTKQCW